MNKIFTLILSWLIILIILVLITFYFGFNISWYDKQYSLNGSYELYSKNTLIQQTQNVLNYIGGTGELDKSNLSEIEILHLADIKNLILLTKQVVIFSLIALIYILFSIYQSGVKKIINSLFYSLALVILQFGLLSALVIIFFDNAFFAFHQLAFNNNYWQLDPSINLLIVIFPPQLFYTLLIQSIIVSLALFSVLFTILGFVKNQITKK